MEVESTILTVDVYHIKDIGGVNGTWIWDFGFITMVGSENHPTRVPDNMELFSVAVNGLDVEDFKEMDPEKTVDVKMYEGDYVTYTETDETISEYALSPNTEPYLVMEEATHDADDVVVLKENKSHGRRETLVVEKDEFEREWTSVNQL